jgi:hypothetical protein
MWWIVGRLKAESFTSWDCDSSHCRVANSVPCISERELS